MRHSTAAAVDLEACRLRTRILVASIGLPVLLLVLLVLPPVYTAVLIAAISVIAVYELLYRTGLVRNIYLMAASAVMALVICLWSYGGCPWKWGAVCLWLYFMSLFVILIASHGRLPIGQLCISAFSGIVIPLFLSSLTRVLLMDYGRFYILIPLILSFSADSGAYFVGVAIGKHKMAPNISPKKSWEGAVGGVLSAMVCMFLYCLILNLAFHFNVRYGFALFYGLMGAVTGILGDLAYSVIKRQTGIKDYGNLLPGHGGVLDRFDSMSLVAPLSECLLLLMPIIVK